MYIIGITGASGSGKTTLAQRLLEHFGDMAVLISLDSYYKDFSHLPFEKRAALNFDAPDIHDHALLEEDLRALLRGEDIPRRDYDFVNHRRAEDNGVISPIPSLSLKASMCLPGPRCGICVICGSLPSWIPTWPSCAG